MNIPLPHKKIILSRNCSLSPSPFVPDLIPCITDVCLSARQEHGTRPLLTTFPTSRLASSTSLQLYPEATAVTPGMS